jgi:hypothetical protein
MVCTVTIMAVQIRCSVCLRRHRGADEWVQINDDYICPECVTAKDIANPPNVVVSDIDGQLRVVAKTRDDQ